MTLTQFLILIGLFIFGLVGFVLCKCCDNADKEWKGKDEHETMIKGKDSD